MANPWDPVSDFWSRQPSELRLHIFVIPPTRGVRFYVQKALNRLLQFLPSWVPLSTHRMSLQVAFFYIHFYHHTVGYRPRPHSAVAIADPKTLQVAQKLHSTVWGRPLNAILNDITDSGGNILKYVSSAHIKDSELRHLGFPEDALLIRHEYIPALEDLTSQSLGQTRGDGVLVTGHSGIGMR